MFRRILRRLRSRESRTRYGLAAPGMAWNECAEYTGQLPESSSTEVAIRSTSH